MGESSVREQPGQIRNQNGDPTANVQNIVAEAVNRIDDLRNAEVKRIDEKIYAGDVKYQIQFNAAKEAVGIALIAQEKAVAAALEGTREAINKADATTDKRFDLLSEKIDGIGETISKNTGAQGIYVTHTDLSVAMDKLQTNIEATLRPVVTFMNSQTGRDKGISSSWGVALGGVGFIATIIATFLALSR